MADIDKVSGVARGDIDKVSGVSKANISKIAGAGSGTWVASKWIIGGGNGKMFRSTISDAGYSTDTATTNWYQIADLGAQPNKSIAVGQNVSGDKRWVVHTSGDGTTDKEEVAYVDDDSEVADPVTGNTTDGGGTIVWTKVALTNNNASANGGPSIAWGQDRWIGVGDDIPDDEHVLFGSSNGASGWSSIQTTAQDENDSGRCVAYKGSDNSWFFTVQDTIYWNSGSVGDTRDPMTGTNWVKRLEVTTTRADDVMSMAYDPANQRWGCITGGGSGTRFYTSTDDWNSLEAGANTPTAPTLTGFNVKGLCFAGGSINKWIAVGTNGKIFISSNADGTSWSQISHGLGSPTHLYQVATDNTTIVAVGTGTTIWASQDGSTWKNVVANGVNGVTSDPVSNFGTACWSISSDVIGAGMR